LGQLGHFHHPIRATASTIGCSFYKAIPERLPPELDADAVEIPCMLGGASTDNKKAPTQRRGRRDLCRRRHRESPAPHGVIARLGPSLRIAPKAAKKGRRALASSRHSSDSMDERVTVRSALANATEPTIVNRY
jgi:hypothetical protein